MSYRIIFFFLLFIITGCKEFEPKIQIIKETKSSLSANANIKYKNTGFALFNNDDLKKNKFLSKKIDNSALEIFHKSLNKNSLVKITNPLNQKSIIAEVISNEVIFSDFYNSVISLRIVELLSLNIEEPYIDIFLISNESTFIAKKAKIFDEERKIAEKAPIDRIRIDNLGVVKEKKGTIKVKEFLYSIKIADFYYKDSAINMIDRITNEVNLKNSLIKKLSNTKYRVLIGPFNDIKKLEESFNKIKLLNFENIEILKNV